MIVAGYGGGNGGVDGGVWNEDSSNQNFTFFCRIVVACG